MTGRATPLLRVEASAELTGDDGRGALEAFRELAAVDHEFQSLLDDYAAGLTLFVDVTVTVRARASDGRLETFSTPLPAVAVELGDIPFVERQVSDLSAKQHDLLVACLAERGIDIDAPALAESFTHVALGPRLTGALDARTAETR